MAKATKYLPPNRDGLADLLSLRTAVLFWTAKGRPLWFLWSR
jgi:hypothetical protein